MKNKFFKRMLSLVAASTMLVGCLAGCGNQNTPVNTSESESVASESTATESQVVEEPTELTYWAELNSNAAVAISNLGEIQYLQDMAENANVEIEYFHPAAGTASEQFNLKIAGNNWEDIVEYKWSDYPGGATQAIADGIIVDLAPYIDEYAPNFAAYLEANPHVKKQLASEGGQIYGFPAIGSSAVSVTAGFAVRKDWLDQLNMEVPTTIADWEEMLTAFKENFGAERPLTLLKADLIGNRVYFAGAWGVYPGFYVDNGDVKYGFMEEGFKEYLTTMHDWAEKGLLDVDSFGNDNKIIQSNLLNDKSGASYGYVGSLIGTVMGSAAETNPEMDLVGVQHPVLNEGDEPDFMRYTWEVRAENACAITTACEDIGAAMRFLDQYYSEEGIVAKNFGTEGVSYEMVNGEPVYTDVILNNPDGLAVTEALGKYTRAAYTCVGIIDARYYKQYYTMPQQSEAHVLWNKYSSNAIDVTYPPVSHTTEESEELALITTAVNTYVEEECTKFIMGKRSLDEFDDFVEELKNMQIDEAIEIKQAAYDRFMAR